MKSGMRKGAFGKERHHVPLQGGDDRKRDSSDDQRAGQARSERAGRRSSAAHRAAGHQAPNRLRQMSSQLTPRWREPDSNPRSPGQSDNSLDAARVSLSWRRPSRHFGRAGARVWMGAAIAYYTVFSLAPILASSRRRRKHSSRSSAATSGIRRGDSSSAARKRRCRRALFRLRVLPPNDRCASA